MTDHTPQGGCRIISQGDACQCRLCVVERELELLRAEKSVGDAFYRVAISQRDAAWAEVAALRAAINHRAQEAEARVDILRQERDANTLSCEAERDAARAEAAEWREKWAQATKTIDQYEDEVTRLRGSLELVANVAEGQRAAAYVVDRKTVLLEALNRYGRHDMTCAKRHSLLDSDDDHLAACDCGLDAALVRRMHDAL